VVADTHELVAELEAAGTSAPASPHLVTISFVAPPPPAEHRGTMTIVRAVLVVVWVGLVLGSSPTASS
jgi:hypothetical protein